MSGLSIRSPRGLVICTHAQGEGMSRIFLPSKSQKSSIDVSPLTCGTSISIFTPTCSHHRLAHHIPGALEEIPVDEK